MGCHMNLPCPSTRYRYQLPSLSSSIVITIYKAVYYTHLPNSQHLLPPSALQNDSMHARIHTTHTAPTQTPFTVYHAQDYTSQSTEADDNHPLRTVRLAMQGPPHFKVPQESKCRYNPHIRARIPLSISWCFRIRVRYCS